MKISMIVACGKRGEIGLNNKIPWHIRADLQNFKSITSGHHIMMGRKTFESIGKPLPNRISLVLTRGNFSCPGVHTFNDFHKAVSFAEESGEKELFITGGAEIYKTLFPYVEKMYLSEVDYSGEADAFLTPIDFSSWELKEEKKYDAILDEEGKEKTPAWTFRIFEKK